MKLLPQICLVTLSIIVTGSKEGAALLVSDGRIGHTRRPPIDNIFCNNDGAAIHAQYGAPSQKENKAFRTQSVLP